MSWDEYVVNTKNNPPRSLLVEALPYVREKKNALDLGAGSLNDAKFLVSEGFRVTVVDSNPSTAERASVFPVDSIEVHILSFDQFSFPISAYDLVNAQYALPFNAQDSLRSVFSKITDSLKKGGVFTGQFFGLEDEWADKSFMSFVSELEARVLLAPFEILVFREEKKMGKTAAGDEKFWHIFHVIARKR